MSKISMLYVTFPDEASAKKVGHILLSEKMIACINIFPVKSLYTWKDALEDGVEYVALLKTRGELAESCKNKILQLHPYDTPCILEKEWTANPEYHAWVYEVTAMT